MATVYCRNCGSEVKGKFCTNCGTPLEESAAGGAPDSGATTVIRSEDLLRKAQEELNQPSSPVPPQPSAGPAETPAPPPWEGQAAPQPPSWTQEDPTAPATPDAGAQTGQWQSPMPGGDQQWSAPATPAGNEGWQNPAPPSGGWQNPAPPPANDWQNPAPPTGSWQEPSSGSNWNAGTLPGAAPAGGSPAGSYYPQQSTTFAGGGTSSVGPNAGIGDLISGAMAVIQNNIPTVAIVAVVYGLIYWVGQLLSLVGHGLGIIGGLIGLVAYAVADTAYIRLTQSGASSPADLFANLGSIVPKLAAALFVMGICIAFGLIGIIIGALVVAAFLAVVPQAVVIDGAGVFGSLGESFRLIKNGGFGPAIVGIVIYIIALIVVAIVCGLILGRIPVVYNLVFGVIFGFLLAWYISYTTLLYDSLKGKSAPVTGVSTGYTGI